MTLADWPCVRTFGDLHLSRVALPVGGIGTGTISLGGRGQLRDWELFNRPAKGHDPAAFLALRTDAEGEVRVKALEAQLLPDELDGSLGSPVPLGGLPRFAAGRFLAAYPFGRVELRDPRVPVEATVGMFNPLVPGDADASGLPLAVLRIGLRNTADRVVRAAVCLSVPNVIGYRAGELLPDGNTFKPAEFEDGTMLLGSSSHVRSEAESHGTIALATIGRAADSTRTTWAHRSWGDSLLDFWDDFEQDGRLDEPPDPARVPTASLVQQVELAPGAAGELTFAIAWHFPNRRAWSHTFRPAPDFGYGEEIVGNHYTQLYDDAADVLRRSAARLPALESSSLDFVRLVTDSDLPTVVQDSTLSTLATLRSTTCFRIADGTFLAWEGSNGDHGSCHGSCTHVWNYQYALEQLYPQLAWTMREVELLHALDEQGLMSFRAGLPLATEGRGWRVAAADGQMGALVRLHRTWQLTGDTDRLRALWPGARRAMEFAWIDNGWDGDRDGLMEGCQHNTMDVEYYGPNGVGQSWYLAALGAMEQLADVVGDEDFAIECGRLRDRGAELTERELFNGSFYEQRVLPPGDASHIAPGLRIRHTGDNPDMGSDDLVDPDLQLGPGCAADQLAGVTMADLAGIRHGLDPEHVRTTLLSIWRHNHREEFGDHFNHLRTFAAAGERGLLNCTYPAGGRPERPSPYVGETWTGLEYTAAAGLATCGEHAVAERIARDVRARYDGRARNPFNEIECGNHYVRSMAAFGLVHAWAAIVVDRATGVISARRVPGRWPVVAGDCLGSLSIDDTGASYEPLRGPALAVEISDP
ncbi:GH116 family glycosyl-hydrolase [Flexivirga meconopsidis]|uniref:GH116 family glycosyl-hydrolase n=1 Tax=Flexivirga meconopsidis TaxID=2977121 RepID=UPI00224036AB|nr:GH116 family glycosyl-hydrolase [Flexivirga meconopsidis]